MQLAAIAPASEPAKTDSVNQKIMRVLETSESGLITKKEIQAAIQ